VLKSIARSMPVMGWVVEERDRLRGEVQRLAVQRDTLGQRLADLEQEHEALLRRVVELEADRDYRAKLEREIEHFKDVDVHALPPIFHYWSNTHLRPLFEVRVATRLRAMGLQSFTLECLELNPHMLARGREHAAAAGVADLVEFVEGDFNAWRPRGPYSAAMASHSLHHVVNLEGLFDGIKSSLPEGGRFVVSDIIGRNGHQRWPEALEQVQALWREMPERCRYNLLLSRHEPEYVNHDCSTEGFEGVRAQDILPLLVERFDFPVFVAFANVIAPFVDRAFGHHFDPESASDRAFIDRIHAIDEDGFRSGALKPTQMIAVMSPSAVASHRVARGLTPQRSIRPPD
jgi:SAM-dependent methyltransferase